MPTLRAYTVTVRPAVVLYAGSWAGREYTVDVHAQTRARAIGIARSQRAAEEGRYAPRATYSARLREEQPA